MPARSSEEVIFMASRGERTEGEMQKRVISQMVGELMTTPSVRCEKCSPIMVRPVVGIRRPEPPCEPSSRS